MTSKEQPDLEKLSESEFIYAGADSWGKFFVLEFEDAFAQAAVDLPYQADFKALSKSVASAVVKVLNSMGASPDEITRLVDEAIHRLVEVDGVIEWTDEKNARRLELINKKFDRNLSSDEANELVRLTNELRDHFDTEEMVPLKGVERLFEKLSKNDDLEPKPK